MKIPLRAFRARTFPVTFKRPCSTAIARSPLPVMVLPAIVETADDATTMPFRAKPSIVSPVTVATKPRNTRPSANVRVPRSVTFPPPSIAASGTVNVGNGESGSIVPATRKRIRQGKAYSVHCAFVSSMAARSEPAPPSSEVVTKMSW